MQILVTASSSTSRQRFVVQLLTLYPLQRQFKDRRDVMIITGLGIEHFNSPITTKELKSKP